MERFYMSDFKKKNPYMDFRNSVPFMDLSGFVINQSKFTDNMPAKSLQEHLIKKKFSTMINIRRLAYCMRVEEYRNGIR
jgi:hypothetical protein